MDLATKLQLETQAMFDHYAELVRDEAMQTGVIVYRGITFRSSMDIKKKPTPISGFNYIAVQKVLDIVPDVFGKETYIIHIPGLRIRDGIKRHVAVIKTPTGQYEIDPTLEEFFVDRSQDIDLSGKKIPRVYGPNDLYPFKIAPNPQIIPYQRQW
ncbi:hypothetical protein HOD05_04255 [Candidatus Woesearchaeota archaeon]|jgi:hypothetical protein|nr:hypothetical protein [Candidatus Woesearchaeota archaeon]MBT4150726.1 hypothetical protein [Candidatus Woesearchaeota archaeon]MBT4247522.1 hypothetical protein [Candidatus Woesearchaeota archaeon]MBT4434407.1 hypothetical protein [Candidatus Woesearchaeota archaeon]MBT7331924.1 hypothetical protein [Candidatus Woesearchaeota archaeon]